MKKALAFIALIGGAIVLTGVLLDEAGKGTFGAQIKQIANKATRGFGQAA